MTTNLFLFAGPALFVATQTWHRSAVTGELRAGRLLTLAALAVAAVATVRAPAYRAATAAAAVLCALAVAETRGTSRLPVTTAGRR